jgi:hypothetical protein
MVSPFTTNPSPVRLEPGHHLAGVLTWLSENELLLLSLYHLAPTNCDSLTDCGALLWAPDGVSSFRSPKIDSMSNLATCGNPMSARRAVLTNGSTTERFA